MIKARGYCQKAQGRRAGSMRSRGSISGCVAPRVVMYAATNLFPLNRNLAEKYVINADNPVGMYYYEDVQLFLKINLTA